MMSAVAPAVAVCACDNCGVDSTIVRYCPDHHRYWRGATKLTSVSRIIRECWPIRKNFEDAPADVLEHARERGHRIDKYFSEYLRHGRGRMPAGEWIEVRVGVLALVDWWKSEGIGAAQAQVTVANASEAGTADAIAGHVVLELKCVSALEPTYDLQVGAYADLEGTGALREGVLLHCKIDATAGRARVRAVPVALRQAVDDWRCLRDVWRIAERRNPKKVQEAE